MAKKSNQRYIATWNARVDGTVRKITKEAVKKGKQLFDLEGNVIPDSAIITKI